MEAIYAYHITEKSNIHSILVNNLVPSIGANSKHVKEKHLLTYFTTLDCIDTWVNRFNLDRNKIVILKFPCTNYGKRYDSAKDYFTKEIVLAQNITVVDDKEKALNDYYRENKMFLDLEEKKKANESIKIVLNRLEEISKNNLTPEEGWDYNEVDPNIMDIIDALKIIKLLSDKSEFSDVLLKIKKQTLEKLIQNDLGITTDTEIYKTLDRLFDDSMYADLKIDLFDINCLTILLSVNLFYRQLDRYKRTGKKYGDDNINLGFDAIENIDFEKCNENNIYLNNLLEETRKLYINTKNNVIKQ